MKKLIFATHNINKAGEIKALLPEFEIISLGEINYHEEIPETGNTLEENALIKAKTIFEHSNLPCFADDTGLEVTALNGAPGVYSARYAGTSEENIDKLLKVLESETDRSARFRTVIAYIDEQGREHFFEGIVKGQILAERRGTAGFGYDAVFLPEGFDKTFAEMNAAEKNAISHRGRAVAAFIDFLS